MKNIRFVLVFTLALLTWNSAWGGNTPKEGNLVGAGGNKSSLSSGGNYRVYANAKVSEGAGGKVYIANTYSKDVATSLPNDATVETSPTTSNVWTTNGYKETTKNQNARLLTVNDNKTCVIGVYARPNVGYRFLGFGGNYVAESVSLTQATNTTAGLNNPNLGLGTDAMSQSIKCYYYGVESNGTSYNTNKDYKVASPYILYATFGIPTINGYLTSNITENLQGVDGITCTATTSGSYQTDLTIKVKKLSFNISGQENKLFASITDAFDENDFVFQSTSTGATLGLTIGNLVYDRTANPGSRKGTNNGNIPVTINTTNRHGTQVATIQIYSKYDGKTSSPSTQVYTFTLTLDVDLTPTFDVVSSWNFGEASASSPKSKAIGDLTSNLSASAKDGNCSWSLKNNSAAFTIDNGNIVFAPTIAGDYEEKVILCATYTDAGGTPVSCEKEITLIGTGVAGGPSLEENDLAFIDPLIIYTNTSISPVTGGNGNPISITLSGTDYLTTDGTTLSGKAVGSTHVTITQLASATVQGATIEADVDVIRHTPQLVLTPGQIVYPHQSYANFVATDNTDAPTGFTANLISGDASLVGSTLTTNETGELTLQVSQAATANYEALDVTKTIYVVANPAHVPVTMSQNLFNNSVLQNLGGEDRNILIENFVVESNNVAWTGSEWDGNAYTGGIDWTKDGKGGSTNQFTMKKDGAYMTIHFSGVPDVMSFTLANRYGQTGTLRVEQSADNSAWTLVEEFTTMGAKSVMLSPHSRYVRFTFTTSTGTEQFSIQGVHITEGQYLRLDTHCFDYMQQADGSYADQQIAFSAANWGNLSVESSSADFSATLSDNVTSAVWDRYVEGTLTIRHAGTADAAWIRILRDAGTSSEALVDYVRVTALPRYIEAGAGDVIYTGQDLRIGADDATIASHQRTFEYAFDNAGNPLFDKLYVFGVTRNMDNAVTTENGVQYPSVTAADGNFGSNAKIPCYIYAKSESRYVWNTTIANMNVAEKNAAFKLDGANGEKLYFTGLCDYASVGWNSNAEGVFHIKGTSGKRVDIYLEKCSISSRSKHSSGKVIGGVSTFENTFSGNYPQGTGGVFVFESTTSGFSPYIHIRGTNYLKSTEGIPHSGDWQWSAPIEVKVTNETSVTNLTMDDLWPISATASEHTNGQLDLTPRAKWSRPINIGNAKTVLTFNGGYYRFAPINSSATGSMYKNFQLIGYSKLSSTYGIGEEQKGGTVIINDGTFDLGDAIPTDVASPACGTSPYKGQPAHLRFPENTTVNGGSFFLPLVACKDNSDQYPGQAIKNKHNDNLIELPLTASLPDPEHNNAVSVTLPDEMEAYYLSKSDAIGYGQKSLRAKDGTVTAMLPADVLGLEDERGYAIYPWVYAMPSMEGTIMGIHKSVSGDMVAANGEKDKNYHLLSLEIDSRTRDQISNYEFPPEAPFSGSISIPKGAQKYSSIKTENNKDYVIRKDLTMMIPIVADHWYTFTAPFDINKVSIMEVRADSKYVALAEEETISDALDQQAADFVDWMAYMVQKIYSGTVESMFFQWTQHSTIDSFRDLWRKYCLQNELNPNELLAELTAFDGSNWAANYFLYEPSVDGTHRSDYWTATGDKLDVKWIPALPETENEGEPNEQTYVMRRGRTYAIQFPFCPGCKAAITDQWEKGLIDHPYEEEWDYWTGKYLVLEGVGPQTIWGSDNLTANELTAFATPNQAAFRGNASFGEVEITQSNLYYHNDEEDNYKPADGNYTAKPGQGFLFVNMPSMSKAPIAVSNPQPEAEVTHTEGSVPTIQSTYMRGLNPTGEPAKKVIINGQLYLLLGDHLYDALGQMVR